MVQQQKKQKQTQDMYAQRGKTLASSVQRLRGWVGSDPSRLPELADALIELTAHRLLSHGYGVAAPDAQEAVRYAAQLLTANGPIGPYTSVVDAARAVTSIVHVAAIQSGAGLPDAAGRTIESMQDMQEQLRDMGLAEHLKPQTAIWALSASARAALASGDTATANAHADAALARLDESGVRNEEDATYLVLDVARLISDCRWAAGLEADALTWLRSARDQYDAVVAGRLSEPGRLSPALLERLAEPLFGVYRDLADRLTALGETDLGLVSRRELVETLQGLTKRLGDPARVQLANALADLAADLLAVDRTVEAEAASAESAALVLDSGDPRSYPLVAAVRSRTLTRVGRSAEAVTLLRHVVGEDFEGPWSAAQAVVLQALAESLRAADDLDAAAAAERSLRVASRELSAPALDLARGVVSRGTRSVSWEPLSAAASYAATTRSLAGLNAPAPSASQTQRETAARLEAERAEAHRREQQRLEEARQEAERRAADQAAAERSAAERRAAERRDAELTARRESERRAAAEEAERLAVKARREERLEAHRLEAERQEAEQREAQRVKAARLAAARAAADPAEAERLELEQLQAELAELEHAEVEAPDEVTLAQPIEMAPVEPEVAEPAVGVEVEAESELVGVEVEAEPEVVQVEAEDELVGLEVEAEPEVVQVEAEDELPGAIQAWRDARARGDRRGARAANELVVELLRPRVQADTELYGPQLVNALEELSSARLRGGDLWGSRAPAKEAKALAKTLGSA